MSEKKDKGHKKKKGMGKRVKRFALLIFLTQIIALAVSLVSKKKRKTGKKIAKLVHDEQEELKDLVTGKNTFHQFFLRSKNSIKDFFIPHAGNDHKPHSVRSKALVSYLLIALILKSAVTGSLYLVYPTPAEMSAIVSSRMLELTNQARTQDGVHPLRLDPVLSVAAQQKGKDMLERDYFAHDTPDGKRPWHWISKSEYDYVNAGENLAKGFIDAESVQAAFMESPTHKKNILNQKYNDVGFAVITGTLQGVKSDILVVMFGRKRGDEISAPIRVVVNESVKIEPTPKDPKKTPAFVEEISNPPATNVVTRGTEINTRDTTEQKNDSQAMGTEIEHDQNQPEGVIVVAGSIGKSKSIVDMIIEYSNILFLAFVIFITVSLLLNIFVRIKVQHKHLIVQSVVVLAIIGSLILTKFHFVEKIVPQLLIL